MVDVDVDLRPDPFIATVTRVVLSQHLIFKSRR